ncbi:MAG TPA: DPP IV N-terminal domain-containing protein, partial [Fimbriimonadaceae bacterium]|nr:DPP IV N-terminal domain-containing protein [Fimbriimonadaceae bacterium]
MRKRPITAEDLFKIQFVNGPQMSPDGKRVLFIKTHIDAEKNKYVGNLFTVEVASGEVKQWTQGEKPGGMGRWSPDGSQMAFVSGREGPSAQIYLLPSDGGEARKLTNLPEGSIGDIVWSPDGKHIAVTFRPLAENRTTKAEKERKEKNGSPPPWEIETLWYRLDGDGYFGQQRYAVYMVDAVTGEHRKFYDKDKLGFYSFDWTPDSKALVIAHSVHRTEPMLKKPNDQIFVVPLKGKVKMIPGLAKGPKGNVAVSPDGKHVAFEGDHVAEEVWGMRNTRLYVSPM